MNGMRRVVLFLLLVLLIASQAHAQEPRKVLVLHAYHQGREWTDRISEGIHSVFAPFDHDIHLHFEYLDVQRNNRADYLPALATFYGFKFKDFRFDAVIAADDDALNFVRSYGSAFVPGAPVVFCGVNWSDSETPSMGENETGVVEQLGHQATLSLMLQLHPHCKRILFLMNKEDIQEMFVDQMKSMLALLEPQVAVEVWRDVDRAELPARLVGLTADDLIYLLAFDHDRGDSDAPANDLIHLVMRWSPAPVYSPLDFYLGKGSVGGMITSGVRQGELAAQMALRVLSGQPVKAIAAVTRSPNQYMFDGRKLKQYGLKSSRLPPGSVVIHGQPLFWNRHGILFLAVAAGLLVVAVILLGFMLRQKDKQRLLAQNNVELDGRVKEKSAQLLLASQRLKKQSLVDSVTGMPNRRHIFQRLSEEIKKSQRYNQPLCILLFDIDGFKPINDQYGYLTGDKVLRDVVQTIRRSLREIDLVGRYGGEEFLVVMPNTTIDMARHCGARIRRAILALQWEQGQVRVTVSGGLAQAGEHSPADLIALADERVRIAKQVGGDRILADEVVGTADGG
ncbi:MAG: diguanylate cyclase [Desulfatitalea sp.]|nr:diguanylate cyclase [Desulfatitalea sp.]